MRVKHFFTIPFFLFLFSMPMFVHALQIIPCGRDTDKNNMIDGTEQCRFKDLITLADNIIKYLIYFSIPIVAIVFAYAGFLYLTSADSVGKASQATSLFTDAAIGFVIVLSAWLIVKTIENVFLRTPGSTLLK